MAHILPENWFANQLRSPDVIPPLMTLMVLSQVSFLCTSASSVPVPALKAAGRAGINLEHQKRFVATTLGFPASSSIVFFLDCIMAFVV